jgi:hypothetical protein
MARRRDVKNVTTTRVTKIDFSFFEFPIAPFKLYARTLTRVFDSFIRDRRHHVCGASGAENRSQHVN